MKILIYADPHFSTYSSILRKRGNNFSFRLENLIDTINFVEQTGVERNCDRIVCLGDFFDKSSLSAEEISALSAINWSNIPHIYLVGNHEISRADNTMSSAMAFELLPNSMVVSSPQVEEFQDFQLCYLPYILTGKKETLENYLGTSSKKRVIFSHNDIAGIEYGKYTSEQGFDVSDIIKNCFLFFNGHLHNHSTYSNLINVGNITGNNFTEDGFKYKHVCLLFDTSTMTYEKIENPYATKFIQLNYPCDLENLPSNSVLLLQCNCDDVSKIKSELEGNNKVLDYKLNVVMSNQKVATFQERKNNIDYKQVFVDTVYNILGNDNIVKSELEVIVSGI